MIGAGWVSGSCLNEADVIRDLQRRHPNYAIGRQSEPANVSMRSAQKATGRIR